MKKKKSPPTIFICFRGKITNTENVAKHLLYNFGKKGTIKRALTFNISIFCLHIYKKRKKKNQITLIILDP